MSWTATVRYDLKPAPGGLALVQDLLNTLSAGRPRRPDLLESVEDAGAWLDQALESWSDATHRPAPGIDLKAEDVRALWDFRHDLNRLVQAPTQDSSPETGPVASLLTLPTPTARRARPHPSRTARHGMAPGRVTRPHRGPPGPVHRHPAPPEDVPEPPLRDVLLRPLPQQQRRLA